MDSDTGVKKMNQKTFKRLKEFIEGHIGICIPQAKKVMVESRLLKRLRILKLNNYEEYADFLFSPRGQQEEVPRFIECITTNKTDFFREAEHFNILYNKVLPEMVETLGVRDLRLWSGASSTGEEAYTIAMFTQDYLEDHPGVHYKILATDISERVLNIGEKAVYALSTGEPIPIKMKKKYCMLSKNREEPTLRIKKILRDKIMFRHINLTSDSYKVKKQYHVIFLRNVMIYFNKDTQKEILNNLYTHLHPEGYLFLGHSENLPDNTMPFKRVGPSVYVKKEKVINE